MNLKYRPGPRALKTALAVLLCLLANLLMGRPGSLHTAFAAVICMQPTTSKSYTVGRGRIIGTVVGALVGFLVLELAIFMPSYQQWSHLLVVPLATMLVIYLFNVLGQTDGLVMGCVVLISIVLDFSRELGDTIWYVVGRVVDTGVGVVIAMLVNHFLFPHKESPPPPEQQVSTPLPEQKVSNPPPEQKETTK